MHGHRYLWLWRTLVAYLSVITIKPLTKYRGYTVIKVRDG